MQAQVGVVAPQTSPAFELLTKLRLAHHDTTRTDLHLQLSEVYIAEKSDAERAIDHANLALILAQNHKDKRREFRALNRLLEANCALKNDLETAMTYLEKVKQIDTTGIPIADIATSYANEGAIFQSFNDFEKSHRMYLQALSLCEKIPDSKGVARVNHALGGLFYEQNNYRQALEHFNKALENFDRANDSKGKMKTLNALGQACGQLGDFDKNFSYCSEALLLARAVADVHEMARIHTNLGFACENLGKPAEAIGHYQAALQTGEETENRRLIAEAGIKLGKIYLRQNNEKEAGVLFLEALDAVEKINVLPLRKEVYETLYQYYERDGNREKAYEFLKLLTSVKDALYDEERTRQLISNQIRYETQKREEEVKLLKANELESRLTIQKQRLGNYALLAFAVLTLTVMFFLYDAFRRKKAYNEHLEEEVNKRTAELEKSNAELKESNRQLGQSNAELERFAYIASHDLKSPLRNVISFLNLIERRMRPIQDANIAEYLRFASENARQMHHLIQDVLEFSRVTQKDGENTPVDLNESLIMVMQNLKEDLQHKNGAVFAGSLPVIEGNSVHLLQLIQNLVGNGIKYNQSQRPRVMITHREDRSCHIVTVKDNGIGIPKEYHEQIFEMFKRLHNKEEYPGSGIGLALCKKIVHNMGGEIWLESEPGKGTTFFVSVPKVSQTTNG
jgi:signal transduction histidine kinase